VDVTSGTCTNRRTGENGRPKQENDDMTETNGAAPEPETFTDEPIGDAPPEAEAEGPQSARGKEWLAQLEQMIQQVSTQAAPVARQVGAKAAELAAVAAVKAGPVAQKAADLTVDYGARFAERAQSVAADLRSQDAATEPSDTGETAAPDATADATQEPDPEATQTATV
jgi:hypothetical protein